MDRETKKSRRFAFMTFESREDAKAAAKDMDRKSLDGKAVTVEQTNKPYCESGGRWRPKRPSRNRSHLKILSSGRGGSGEERGSLSREGHFDDDGYTLSLNMSSSKGPFPVNRGLTSRSGNSPPKKSSRSDARQSNSGKRRQGPVSHGRKKCGGRPCREAVSSRSKYCISPRDGGYATKDSYSSRDYPCSRDYKDYAPQPRDYAHHGYVHAGSPDERSSRRHSDRDGCGGGHGRDYSEHTSGSSYRDSYESYGNSHGTPPDRATPLTYSGRGHYDGYYTQHGYGAGHESYSCSQSDICLSGGDHRGRRERKFSPSMDRVYSVPCVSYNRSSYRASREDCGGSPSEKVQRNRY